MNVICIEINCLFTISSKPSLLLEWLDLLSTERKLIFLLVRSSFHLRSILSNWKHFSKNYLDIKRCNTSVFGNKQKFITSSENWWCSKKENQFSQPARLLWQDTGSKQLPPPACLLSADWSRCSLLLSSFVSLPFHHFFPPEVNFANLVLLYLLIQLTWYMPCLHLILAVPQNLLLVLDCYDFSLVMLLNIS